MAETSSAQDLPPGHLYSPLLKMIPTEVRLEIYRHTFAGSETALQLHPDATKPLHRSGPLPVGGRRSVFYSSRYQLLLTCKQIYNEALAIYWSETIVCNDEGRFSRGLFFERIPDFAKLHIKHLRDVHTCVNPGVKALHGIAFGRQASFAEVLDAFPKLQTCSVRHEAWGTQPSKAVEEALARHPEVHILKTWLKFRLEPTMIWKRTHIDFTTGAEYSVDEDKRYEMSRMDEEEGFRRVMELKSSREAGVNCEA